MALRKAKNGDTPTLAELQAQRSELAGRLGPLAGQLARLDPVNDWELMARALGERQALEMAVQALAERIEAAQREQAAGAAGAREQERQERAAVACVALESKARAVCDLVQFFDAGALAELEAAARELGACGGWPDPAAGVALRLAGAVDAALAQWRLHAPTWLGLPEPPSVAELALKEARAAVARSEQRLDDLRGMKRQGKHGAAQPDNNMLVQAAGAVLACRRRLLFLTDGVALDSDDGLNRCLGGLGNELSGWLEAYYEAQRRAQVKAQQEAQAQQSPVMA